MWNKASELVKRFSGVSVILWGTNQYNLENTRSIVWVLLCDFLVWCHQLLMSSVTNNGTKYKLATTVFELILKCLYRSSKLHFMKKKTPLTLLSFLFPPRRALSPFAPSSLSCVHLCVWRAIVVAGGLIQFAGSQFHCTLTQFNKRLFNYQESSVWGCGACRNRLVTHWWSHTFQLGSLSTPHICTAKLAGGGGWERGEEWD